MSEFYELTSLACPMLGTSEVAKAARDWLAAPDATGTLLKRDEVRFVDILSLPSNMRILLW
jgi:hypothetical protein